MPARSATILAIFAAVAAADPQLHGLRAINSLPSDLFSAKAHSTKGDPAKPTIPAQWTAHANISSGVAIHGLSAVPTTIYTDDAKKRSLQIEIETLDFLNGMVQVSRLPVCNG
jgi:hypothetical protein